MKPTVYVTADAAGNVVIPSKDNPEWGHIRVEMQRLMVDERGFARRRKISALIPGEVKDLKDFGWQGGEVIEGTIIFKEQLTPFNPKDPNHDLKVAGKTGVVCTYKGQPIYRKTFYKQDATEKDQYILDDAGHPIGHDNGDEIRAARKTMADAEKQGAGIGNM